MQIEAIHIVGILSTIGIGAIILAVLKRRWSKTDERDAAHETREGKEIDADRDAFQSIFKRLETVEARLHEVMVQLTDQKVENAKLEGLNNHLSQENARQEKEIQRLRERQHELTNEIQSRDGQIYELNNTLKRREEEISAIRKELFHTTQTVNSLSKKIDEIDAHTSQG